MSVHFHIRRRYNTIRYMIFHCDCEPIVIHRILFGFEATLEIYGKRVLLSCNTAFLIILFKYFYVYRNLLRPSLARRDLCGTSCKLPWTTKRLIHPSCTARTSSMSCSRASAAATRPPASSHITTRGATTSSRWVTHKSLTLQAFFSWTYPKIQNQFSLLPRIKTRTILFISAQLS